MVFLNFWKFFSMFLEFSITCRVGTKRNNNFCFPSFSAFFNVFWPELKPQWYFFNFFLIFPVFFRIFRYASCWNGTWWKSLFYPFLSVSLLILAWNWVIIVFYNSLNFFAICLEFSKPRWVGTKRNASLYFVSFTAFSHQFLLEKKP